MYKYKRNGFTIVELMAVIIIISLIALLTFPNIINQIKKTKKSNNKMMEDVVIEQAKKYVNDNKEDLLEDEYCLSISTLIDNDYIKEDIVNINDIKDNKVVHITLDNNNSYEVVDKNKCFLSAVKYLLKKTNPITVTNYTDGDIHEMYTFEHEATVQTPALTDYRYIGSDPNNYVEFNNEIWRIIGLFDTDNGTGKYEKRIKIVRDEFLDGNFKYDDNGTNDWEHSSTCSYLNDNYYNSLSSDLKSYINDVKYYLGGVGIFNGNSDELYILERGTLSAGNRNIMTVNKFGLIYPSDYLYTFYYGVDDICSEKFSSCKDSNYQSSWLYNESEWTISPSSYTNATNRAVAKNVGFTTYSFVSNTIKIRPAVYLSSKVKITSGDGTESNPYELSM